MKYKLSSIYKASIIKNKIKNCTCLIDIDNINKSVNIPYGEEIFTDCSNKEIFNLIYPIIFTEILCCNNSEKLDEFNLNKYDTIIVSNSNLQQLLFDYDSVIIESKLQIDKYKEIIQTNKISINGVNLNSFSIKSNNFYYLLYNSITNNYFIKTKKQKKQYGFDSFR